MAAEPPHPRFRAGDYILDDRYIVVHKDSRKIPTVPAEPVDTGGAGTVYRVGFRDRALKILTMPSRRQDPQKGAPDYQSTFGREQRLLALLSHGNIVRLYEFGDSLQHENKPLFGEKEKDAVVLLGSRTKSISCSDAASDPDQLLAHSPFVTFDTRVFGLSCNDGLVGDRVSDADIDRLGRKLRLDSKRMQHILEGWYNDTADIPYPLDALVCQRQNLGMRA